MKRFGITLTPFPARTLKNYSVGNSFHLHKIVSEFQRPQEDNLEWQKAIDSPDETPKYSTSKDLEGKGPQTSQLDVQKALKKPIKVNSVELKELSKRKASEAKPKAARKRQRKTENTNIKFGHYTVI